MMMVLLALALWDEHLDPLADEFASRVSEKIFGLGVDLNDDAFAIHGHDSVRNGFQKAGGQEGFGDTRRPRGYFRLIRVKR
jgi:hypothetical protein